jgi:hypothetical protein
LADRGGWETDVVTSSSSSSVFPGFRVLLLGEEVHDRDEQDRGRLAEVDQFPDVGVSQDRLGLAQVGQHDAGVPVAGEQGAGMHVRDRVIIHVDDPDVRRDLLGDLVHITGIPVPTSMIWRMPAWPARNRTARCRKARFSRAIGRTSGAARSTSCAARRSTT